MQQSRRNHAGLAACSGRASSCVKMNKPVLIKVLGSHQLQFEEVFRPVTNYTKEDLFFESVLSLNVCLVGVYPVPSSSF